MRSLRKNSMTTYDSEVDDIMMCLESMAMFLSALNQRASWFSVYPCLDQSSAQPPPHAHHLPPVQSPLATTVLQDARHLVAMAKASLSPGLNEPSASSSASSATRDVARAATSMDHNPRAGSVSNQTDGTEYPDNSTSTTYTDVGGGSYGYGDGAGSASTISAAGGDGSHAFEAGSMIASSREKQERKVVTASSGADGRTGKGSGCSDSVSRPYLPLHGLISFISDLHMKTPQEILEKVKRKHPYTDIPMHA